MAAAARCTAPSSRARCKIPRVVVPPEPGNFSAMGMLLADPRLDTARTFVAPLDAATLPQALAIWAELEAEGGAALRREFGDGDITFEREAEIRYKGQQHSLKIALPADADAAALRAVFDTEYQRRYGHANAAADAQLVVLHSLATLQMMRPELASLFDRARYADAATPRGAKCSAARTRRRAAGRSTSWRRTASSTPPSMTATLCRSDSPGTARR